MRSFILGTDWWTDCDDAVAIRLMARAAQTNRINLLGVAINAAFEYSVPSLKRFLELEGLCDIPLGIDLAATDFSGKPPYQKRLAEQLPEVSNADAEDAVRLYRRLLAEANEKIEIAEIGFLQAITAVLESGADDISPKSGAELFEEKVTKVWVMAGKWDADGEREHNFCLNERSRIAAERFCRLCPVPVTFLGWEIGYGVITGDQLDRNDHLYTLLSDHGSAGGRHSWDPMLVLMAIIGDEEAAGYGTVTGTARVDERDGSNYFTVSENGKHKYVTKKHSNVFYESQINNIISAKIIENQKFDEERALYASSDVIIKNCRFEGEGDGESALKESADISALGCYFDLRYPFWHDTGVYIGECELTERCRAALWYSENIRIENSLLHGIKALRECKDAEIHGCDIISAEFGWSVDGIRMSDTRAEGEYFMLRSSSLEFNNTVLFGKYSFQYITDSVFDGCIFNTKDAFWHAKNVTVKNSVINGEYLAWYSENITFENCKISGTQPFCYCRGLRLINCEMTDADLAFEKSEVEATITSPVISIKNPRSGFITLPYAEEIILDEATECRITETEPRGK